MSGLTVAEADRLLNEDFGSTAKITKRANVYYGLLDAAGVEITGSGYARVQIPVNDTNWSAPATEGLFRFKANLLAVTFPDPVGDWNGGLPTPGCALWDAASGGVRIWEGDLPTPRTIIAGDDPPQAPPGSIKVKLGVSL